MRIASLAAEISTMIYPTETEERVKELVFSLCGKNLNLKEEKFTSHYGYSFKVITCELPPESAEEVLRRVICSLNKLDFMNLIETLDTRLEGRNLYIRLSKQDLALREFRLYRGDPGGYIRLKFSFRKADPEEIREAIKKVERDCTQT